MYTSQKGLELIGRFEGMVLGAYNDPVGHCTAGIGHLIHLGPCKPVDIARFKGMTKAGALALLADDVVPFEQAVRQLVKVPISQCQFDALVSLAFNIGIGAFEDSTVLRELNKRHYRRARLAFLMWTKAGGRTLLGLSRRRRAEMRRFKSKRGSCNRMRKV